MKFALIIPAYNEEKRIGKTLDNYSDYFEKIRKEEKIEYEIVVVINNTKDKTESIVKEKQKQNHRIFYLNLKEGGKGNALIQGFRNSVEKSLDLVGFVDADLATSPKTFYELIKNIKNDDGIIASRYVKFAVVKPKQNLKRRIISRVGNLIIRALFLFPYRDTQCGAKVFKKNSLKKIIPELGITNWAFDVDLIYHLRKEKMKIREFPTVWSDIENSTLNLKKAAIQVLMAIIQLRILNSPFKKTFKLIKPLVEVVWKKIR